MMKRIFLSVIFVLCSVVALAQDNAAAVSASDMEAYKKQITEMVDYLFETLNFIGDSVSPVQEKEIIFNESWSKIFTNADAMIEDDLDTLREMVVNKDVRSYLRDIEFFFRQIRFSHNIEKITALTSSANTTYFMVTMTRTIEAVGLSGEPITNTQQRFIEINLDPLRKDLRIASIYTHNINENEDLRNWWNGLTPAWRTIIAGENVVFDTIPLAQVVKFEPQQMWRMSGNATVCIKTDTRTICTQLKNILDQKVLSVANRNICNLTPVSKFRKLEVFNCANTPVTDVSPLRNLSDMRVLNISNTHVNDISSLRFLTGITDLYAANTELSDISVLENFGKLNRLNISNTQVGDLTPLSGCHNLVELNVSGTPVVRLDPIKNLVLLTNLDISRTQVALLTPIEGLHKLKSIDLSSTKVSTLVSLQGLMDLSTINCSRTDVSQLNYLKGHVRLHKIYCDSTKVSSETANRFISENKQVLVVFETDVLQQWWNNLPIYWQEVFLSEAKIENSPTTEDLHRIINLRSLDIHNNRKIHSLTQISRLSKLEKLNISGTNIKDISVISDLAALKIVDMSGTKVSNVSSLSGLPNLTLINIENTKVTAIDTLWHNPLLKVIYADGSDIEQDEVYRLYVHNPIIRVTFQTKKLNEWWGTLDEDWRYILKKQIGIESELNPSSVQLHKIFYLTSLTISPETRIQSLEPMLQLIFVNTFRASNNDIRDIGPLQSCHLLRTVEIDGNPIASIDKLRGMRGLTSLNISGIPAADFSALEYLVDLEKLNVSSTSIKSLKPLSVMTHMRDLDISNTSIKSLDVVRNMPELKYLKANNTRIKKKTVAALQQERVEMNIVYF